MKNYKKFVCYIIFIALVTTYFYPRKVTIEHDGVIYRLGNSNYSEDIKVSINGYISKRVFKGDKFQGFINVGDKRLSKINMTFDNFGRGILFCYDESIGEFKSYGDLISDNMKEEFTIIVLDENEQKNRGSSWSSEDGLMISAPAKDRNDALNISNKLMKDILVKELK